MTPRTRTERWTVAVMAGLVGGLALLMSHPAVMVAGLSGALLAAHWLRSDPPGPPRRPWRRWGRGGPPGAPWRRGPP